MKLIPAGGAGIPTVAMLLYDGVEIIDISGPWEAFGTAGFLVHTVAEKPDPLTLVFNQKVLPDFTFENSPGADILLVPGGGYTQAMANPRLIAWLQSKANEVGHVMSVCTGAFILGKAGLLSGQTATATYGMVDDLLAFPNTKVVRDQRYVDSGKIITTAGLTSGIDGALHLIAKLAGLGAAQSAALEMEYHWDPDSPFIRASLADRYLPDGLAFGKGRLNGAEVTLISTQGGTDDWRAKILVSKPGTQAGVVNLLRARIAANADRNVQSMTSARASTGSSGLVLRPQQGDGNKVSWKFIDDKGHPWRGLGLVEPAPGQPAQFYVTLEVARIGGKSTET